MVLVLMPLQFLWLAWQLIKMSILNIDESFKGTRLVGVQFLFPLVECVHNTEVSIGHAACNRCSSYDIVELLRLSEYLFLLSR